MFIRRSALGYLSTDWQVPCLKRHSSSDYSQLANESHRSYENTIRTTTIKKTTMEFPSFLRHSQGTIRLSFFWFLRVRAPQLSADVDRISTIINIVSNRKYLRSTTSRIIFLLCLSLSVVVPSSPFSFWQVRRRNYREGISLNTGHDENRDMVIAIIDERREIAFETKKRKREKERETTKTETYQVDSSLSPMCKHDKTYQRNTSKREKTTFTFTHQRRAQTTGEKNRRASTITMPICKPIRRAYPRERVCVSARARSRYPSFCGHSW